MRRPTLYAMLYFFKIKGNRKNKVILNIIVVMLIDSSSACPIHVESNRNKEKCKETMVYKVMNKM